MRLSNRNGFSLVELAVVLVIAGIILAIGAPPLVRYLEKQKVRDGARQLAGEMRLARQRAVTDNCRGWIWCGYSTADRYYYWGLQKKNTAGAWLTTVWHGPFYLPGNVKQVTPTFGGTNSFYYNANGRPNASGSVKFTSANAAVVDTVTVNLDLAGGVW